MDSPVKKYLPLNYQEVKFAYSKKKRASHVLSTEVDIQPSEHEEYIPSEISVEKISDGNRRDILFPGKAMDIYYQNSYMAYTKDVIKLGVPESRVIVRRLDSGVDFEVTKYYAGCKIQDLAFGYTAYPILLACVYDNARVDVHRVAETYDPETETVDFSVDFILLLEMDTDYDKPINFRRIFWCPHDAEDDGNENSDNGTISTPAGIFALYSGNKVDVYNLDLLRKHCAARNEASLETIAETKASVTLKYNNKKTDHDLITDLRVSPDGKQLAYVANDGYIRTYQISFGEKESLEITRFRRLYPPGTILSFIFLDEGRDKDNSNWDLALIFAHNLNEAKIWRYDDEWDCLQTVRVNASNVVIDEFYCGYKFYAENKNRYVLLLDTRRNALYALIFQKIRAKVLVVDCVMEFLPPQKILSIYVANTDVKDIDMSDSESVKRIIEHYGNFFFEDRVISLTLDAYVLQEKTIERVAMKNLLPPLPKDDFSRENLAQLVTEQNWDELDGISEQLENLEICVEKHDGEAPVIEEFVETLGQAVTELGSKVEEDRKNFPDVLDTKLQESVGKYLENDDNDLQIYIQNCAKDEEILRLKALKKEASSKFQKKRVRRKKALLKFFESSSSISSTSSFEKTAGVGDANERKTGEQICNEINVAKLIVKGKYDEAFIFALDSKDIDLINLACNEVDFEDIFDDESHAIDDETLLGLIMIICQHLTTNSLIEKSVKFLQDAIYFGRVNEMIEEEDFLKIYAQLRKILLKTELPDLIIFCHQLMRYFPLTTKSDDLRDAKKADNANERLLKVLRKNDLAALIKFLRKDNMECIFSRDALSSDVVYILALRLADILPYDEGVTNCYLPGVIRLWQSDKLCKSKFPKLWANVTEKLKAFCNSSDQELSLNATILLSISTY